ncbi:hypothetical protein AKJ48_02140 [candidate division MSBL1 archaeon SCGC-AAA261O19]|uniref:Uncharacterized protein n=2 Tax=candidate division MSBL1 TaxID=215777 RepID=A0A133V0F5_9EURY|nr:hypothetical protein AKJ42_02160 [candidate division MSBL1 archaeon SCGC-AAA261C02]KXB04578.1 hypothetical protein AKJ48_02140 [candidate division MSBL1 archaeon SCGC-AAA261O19]
MVQPKPHLFEIRRTPQGTPPKMKEENENMGDKKSKSKDKSLDKLVSETIDSLSKMGEGIKESIDPEELKSQIKKWMKKH